MKGAESPQRKRLCLLILNRQLKLTAKESLRHKALPCLDTTFDSSHYFLKLSKRLLYNTHRLHHLFAGND